MRSPGVLIIHRRKPMNNSERNIDHIEAQKGPKIDCGPFFPDENIGTLLMYVFVIDCKETRFFKM